MTTLHELFSVAKKKKSYLTKRKENIQEFPEL